MKARGNAACGTSRVNEVFRAGKKLTRHVAGLVLLTAGLFLPGEAQAQLRIMPLGDSITEGAGSLEGAGYRAWLADLIFPPRGYRCDFVGSLSTGPDDLIDKQHEGWPGENATFIRANVGRFLRANPPQVVFLMIGTNDITDNRNPSDIRDDIGAAIDSIFAYNNQIEIYLGEITTRLDKPVQVGTLNDLLPGLVTAKQSKGTVILVNMPDIPAARMADNVHPLDRGYELIAEAWFDALSSRHAPSPVKLSDDFNRTTGLGANWAAPADMRIQNNQLVNTSPEDSFDFMAIAKNLINPRVVSLEYGASSGTIGRAYTGIAVMLDQNQPNNASGYLLFYKSDETPGKIRLYEIANGQTGRNEIETVETLAPKPQPGDQLQVEIGRDELGHKFTVTIKTGNGTFSSILRDSERLQGRGAKLYSGVMINGATQNQNGVDNFLSTTESDLVSPGDITALALHSVSSSSITITFAATGDDGIIGAASSYDVRYSEAPITASNFASAARATGIRTPGNSGDTETVTISGLQGDTEYYIALKALDEVGNASRMSAVLQAKTAALAVKTDKFEGTATALDANWIAGSSIRIVSGTAQNTGTNPQFAVLKTRQNILEISMKLGPQATIAGGRAVGILVLADSSATPTGYLIQRLPAESGQDKIGLFLVQNGIITTELEHKNAVSGIAPQAGTIISVEYLLTGDTYQITINMDGVPDRIFENVAKPDNGNFAGFMLEGMGVENAVDEFSVAVPIKPPSKLSKISGDGQVGAVEQPLSEELKVRLVDADNNPISGKQINFSIPAPDRGARVETPRAADGGIRVEAESGVVTAPAEVRNDAEASRQKYVTYPNVQGPNVGVVMSFQVPSNGDYRIWTRSRINHSQSGRWSVRIDNGSLFDYVVFNGEVVTTWEWDILKNPNNANGNFALNAGAHTIEFIVQRPETWLDKIIVTSNLNFTPNGPEDPGFTTDVDGLARAQVVFGNTAGTITVSAKHGTLLAVTFTASASGGAAQSMTKAGGDGQTGTFGSTLAQPLTATVKDVGGNLVANHKVSWVITNGDGKLSNYVSTTDITGKATTTLTLGVSQAANKVEARSVKQDGVTSLGTLVFTATASGGQPTTIARGANGGGNAQSGRVKTPLATNIEARVNAGSGSGVPNVPLDFNVQRGGGSLSANVSLLNAGFEASNGSLPNDWTPENNPSTSELNLNTTDPKEGARSLQINSSRTVEVGVSQTSRYAASTNYVLTFWAKVTTGTARVRWLVENGAGGKTIDIHQSGPGNTWVNYRLIENNVQAGNRPLSFVTDGKASNFFIDDVQIYPATNGTGLLTTTWTLGDTAGPQAIAASGIVNGPNLNGSPLSFTATATSGAAAQLKVDSGNSQVGSGGQPLALPLVAKVTDNTGVNGVANVAVVFTVRSTGGAAGKIDGTLATKTVRTTEQGLASILYTLGTANDVENIVEATSTGLSPATVVFTAMAAVPGNFNIAGGQNQSATAGRRVSTPLGYRVGTVSPENRPIAGYPVKFEVLQNGGTINGNPTATIFTESNGIARATLLCASTPNALIQVRASIAANGQTVAGSQKIFSIHTYPLKGLQYVSGDNQQGGVVGNFLPQPFIMSVLDSTDTTVPGQKVKFEVTAGGGTLEGEVLANEVATDTSGRASIRYKLGTQPVENRISASITPALPGSPRVFRAVAKASAADSLIKVSGDSSKGVVGNPMPSPFVVKVGDRFGNGVAGREVIFSVIAGGGKLANGLNKDTVTTVADGRAQVTLTLGTSTTGSPYNNVVEVRAFNGSIPLRNTPLRFYATATASRARSMIATGGNRQYNRAGLPLGANFSVRVNDVTGNAVDAHPVVFRVTRGGGKFANGRADSTVNTSTNGVAALRLILGGTVLPDSQIVTATATDGTGPLVNAPLTFVAYARAGLPSQATSRVTTSPSTVQADGATDIGVTVEVQDSFGNPVAEETVIIEVTNGPNAIKQPMQKTNALGRATGSFSSTKSGPKVVSAYIPSGIRITNAATVQFTPLQANRLALISGNGQTGNLNTAVGEPLTLRVADRFGNGVPNHPVSFRVHSGAGTMSNGTGNETVTTNGEGNAEAYFVFGSVQGESQIRAESQGLANSPIIFLANAVDRPARNLVYVSGNEQTGIVSEAVGEPLIVKVTDADGNAVYNKVVNLQVTFGNGTLSATSVSTNEFGEAQATWTLGPQAGLNTVRATSEGLSGSPFDFSAQALGGRACCLVPSAPGVVRGPVGGQSGPIQVRVTDGLGNGIDGYTVEFELAQGTGVLTQTRVVTSGGGTATTRLIFDNVSGYRKIRAYGGNLSGSPVMISVYAQPAAAVSMSAVPRTNNQGGTVAKPLNFPLQVKLLDPFGNPAVDEAVNFVVTSGGGSLNGGSAAVTAISDSNGVAQAVLTLGNSTGQNRVNAIKSGGNAIPPLSFTATAFTNNFPIFTDVPDPRVLETNPVEFSLTANDADADGMSFGARNLPPGAAFDSINTRRFSWEPDYNSAGVYEPEFLVRDGKGGIDIEVVRIHVLNLNRPPDILSRIPVGNADPAKADTTILTGPDGVARFTMRVNARDLDPEDRLIYRWSQNGQPVGTNSNTFNFVGVLGITIIQCSVSDGATEVTTEWAMKVPVALNTFSASVTGKAVMLQWSTNAEFNNVGFYVHRSQNLAGPYTRLTTELIAPRRDGDYTFVDHEVQAGGRYYYKLEDLDASGKSTLHGPVQVQMALPQVYSLSQNYPNPFNPTTNIQFELPKPGVVRLFVYNSLGQVVARLVNGTRDAGYHTVLWSGRDLHGNPVPSGVYHYRLEAEGYVMTKKMVLAK